MEIDRAPQRAVRITRDWQPSPEERHRARQLGYNDQAIDWEVEHFVNYWLGRSDIRGAKADWPATFRNHLMSNRDGYRSGNPFLGGGASNRPKSGGVVSSLRRLINEVDGA